MMFVLRLANDYPSLAKAELRAVLEAELGYSTNFIQLGEFVVLDLCREYVERIVHRLALLKEFGQLISLLNEDVDGVVSVLKDVNARFDVERVRGFGSKAAHKLYEILVSRSNARSNKKVKVVLVDGIVLIYEYIPRKRMAVFGTREPHRRPIYRPGAMKAELARVFVNLSRVRRGEVLMDPFCGVGGFAIEACTMGISTICIDVDKRMVEGCKENVEFYECKGLVEVIQSDSSRRIMKSFSVDAIASDPPYGRQSVSRGMSLTELYERFVSWIPEVLRSGRYAAFAVPKDIDGYVKDRIREHGMVIVERLLNRVHGGLTRIVYVVKVP